MKPLHLKKFALLQFRNAYNPIRRLLRSARPEPTGFAELDAIRERAHASSDISDHLVTLFLEALATRPRLIVELGVRGGESTFALERAARLLDAPLVSVDIEPCTVQSSYAKWTFVQQDDLVFAQEFPEYARSHNLPAQVDLLFLDTSHEFEHTHQEIERWFPLVSGHGKVIFHDTHMREFYFTRDGTLRFGWDNQRGVIRAIEAYLGKPFDETKDFLDASRGWLIRHTAISNGLTVLERLPRP